MTHSDDTRTRRATRRGSTPSTDPVHFHIGADGRPYVCDFDRCDSPAVEIQLAPAH